MTLHVGTQGIHWWYLGSYGGDFEKVSLRQADMEPKRGLRPYGLRFRVLKSS